MERKQLSVRFGIGLVYYMDGVEIPEPAALALSEQEEEEDGISPEEWTCRLVAFAEGNGITHIWDDNVAEDGWPNGSGEALSISDFKDLVRELYGV